VAACFLIAEFLPRDALECKARSCYRMSSVCLSDRLSVRPSVTLVDCDHIQVGILRKYISRLVSLGCLLSADPHIGGLLKWEHTEILAQNNPPPVDLSVGNIRSQIAAEWLQIAQRLQWRAYRKPPSLFRMVPSLTPYDLPFPQMGFHMPQDTRMAISPQRVIRYSSCLVICRVFRVGGSNGAISGYIKSNLAAGRHFG